MKGLHLYFRAHHTYAAAAFIACSSVVTGVIGAVQFSVSGRAVFDLPLFFVLPILPAALIGSSLRSPRAEQERLSPRSQRWLRALHLGSLILLALAGQMSAVVIGGAVDLAAVEMRNVAGLTGLALVGGFMLGASLSSVLPLLAVTIPFAVFDSLAADPTQVWTFVGQPPDSAPAGLTAIALLGLGLLLCMARPVG